MSGTEHNQVYLSLGSSTVRGIIPNNVFERYNLTFKNVFTALQDKLRLTFSFKFVRENDRNMLAQGQYFNPLTSVYLFPRGESFDAYRLSSNLFTASSQRSLPSRANQVVK